MPVAHMCEPTEPAGETRPLAGLRGSAPHRGLGVAASQWDAATDRVGRRDSPQGLRLLQIRCNGDESPRKAWKKAGRGRGVALKALPNNIYKDLGASPQTPCIIFGPSDAKGASCGKFVGRCPTPCQGCAPWTALGAEGPLTPVLPGWARGPAAAPFFGKNPCNPEISMV